MSGPIDFALIESVLREAATAAAGKTLPLFRTALNVDNKWSVGFDPVTEADREAERAIREVIGKHFPDHAIVGEEWGNTGQSRLSWTIDPVDGTRAFIFGVPSWGTLIGFSIDGQAVAGSMTQPFLGETFLAVPGRASYSRGDATTPLRVSGRTALNTARLVTTTPVLFEQAGLTDNWTALQRACLETRFSLDCYAYALLAAGHIDLVVDIGLQSYDITALIPIIKEAGGVVTTFEGGGAENGGSVIAAATGELRDAALEAFRSA